MKVANVKISKLMLAKTEMTKFKPNDEKYEIQSIITFPKLFKRHFIA